MVLRARPTARVDLLAFQKFYLHPGWKKKKKSKTKTHEKERGR